MIICDTEVLLAALFLFVFQESNISVQVEELIPKTLMGKKIYVHFLWLYSSCVDQF